MQTELAPGASLCVHALETLASSTAAARLHEQIYDLLAREVPVSLTVTGLGAEDFVEQHFAALCELLRSTLAEAGVAPSRLGIVIDASTLAPQQAWGRRSEILGAGPVYLLLDSSLTPPASQHDLRRRQDRFWLQCWQLRNRGLLRTALAPLVSSPCPLLVSEHAPGILPPAGLQVPPGTAWVPLQISLVDFATASGVLDMAALADALRRCMEHGDACHERIEWPTAAMRHDAWLNRRLAICIGGIGDLALRRGYDPTSFRTLQDLACVLQQVREVVNDYSRQLAAQHAPAPSLQLADNGHAPAWAAQWQQALQFAAVRHRNLLAMSPWSLFPSAAAADSRYSDLLPLLEFTDVCAFPEPPCLRQWNINKFKHFHHRLWAVLEQKDARKLFAESI